MTKFVVLVVCFCVVIVGNNAQRPSSKFDNIDVDAVLSNKRLLKNYVDCLLGTRACTPEGAEVKRLLPESIKTNCAECSPKQKENSKKVLTYFLNTDADYWERLERMYDPTGEYKKRTCDRARRDGLTVGKRCQ